MPRETAVLPLGLFNSYVSHLGGWGGVCHLLIFPYMGGWGKTYFLTLTGRGVLICGSSREYSCIIVACIGHSIDIESLIDSIHLGVSRSRKCLERNKVIEHCLADLPE